MMKFWSGLSLATRIGSIVGATASVPFAVYTGVVLGTLGGGWGWSLAGPFGTLVGIVVMIIFVAGSMLLVGASVGGLIGSMIGRLLKGTRQTQ
jgi:hypothetical protein